MQKYDEVKEVNAALRACPVTYTEERWEAFWLGWKAAVKSKLHPDNADMFWDADDPETSYGSCLQEMSNNLADNMTPHDGRVKLNVQCAVSLPDIKLEVWVVDGDEERKVHYEIIEEVK